MYRSVTWGLSRWGGCGDWRGAWGVWEGQECNKVKGVEESRVCQVNEILVWDTARRELVLKGVVVCEDFCGKEGEGVVDSVTDDVTVKETVVEGRAWGEGAAGRVLGVCSVGSLRVVIMSSRGWKESLRTVHVQRRWGWLAGMRM